MSKYDNSEARVPNQALLARIAALEAAAKKLLDELHWYTPHSTAQRDAESELRALLKS